MISDVYWKRAPGEIWSMKIVQTEAAAAQPSKTTNLFLIYSTSNTNRATGLLGAFVFYGYDYV